MSEQDHLSVLESLIRQSLTPLPEPKTMFDPQRDQGIAATYFLLDVDRAGGVELFVTHTLVSLVQQLNRRTEQWQSVYRGQVRGRILWPATYKARYSEGYDPTRYVCREVRRRYDLPENQLLKYMIIQLSQALKIVPDLVRLGHCYLPSSEERVSQQTAVRLGRMETALNQVKRNIYLQEISTPERITEYHLLRAETALNEGYHQTAKIYRHYQQAVLSPSWQNLTEIGRRVLPLPNHHSGPAAERWIRLGAAILRA